MLVWLYVAVSFLWIGIYSNILITGIFFHLLPIYLWKLDDVFITCSRWLEICCNCSFFLGCCWLFQFDFLIENLILNDFMFSKIMDSQIWLDFPRLAISVGNIPWLEGAKFKDMDTDTQHVQTCHKRRADMGGFVLFQRKVATSDLWFYDIVTPQEIQNQFNVSR